MNFKDWLRTIGDIVSMPFTIIRDTVRYAKDPVYGHEYKKTGSQNAAPANEKNIFTGMSAEQAKKTYHELMKSAHPDNGGSGDDAENIGRMYREYRDQIA